MTYKELLELAKKHPNPFLKKDRHDKEFEYKYRAWVEQQNQAENIRKTKDIQR